MICPICKSAVDDLPIIASVADEETEDGAWFHFEPVCLECGERYLHALQHNSRGIYGAISS